jgi:hypothetical protein
MQMRSGLRQSASRVQRWQRPVPGLQTSPATQSAGFWTQPGTHWGAWQIVVGGLHCGSLEQPTPASVGGKPASLGGKPASLGGKPASLGGKPASVGRTPVSEPGKPASDPGKPASAAAIPLSSGVRPVSVGGGASWPGVASARFDPRSAASASAPALASDMFLVLQRWSTSQNSDAWH